MTNCAYAAIQCVYKLTHIPSGRSYIGGTKNLRNRMSHHINELRRGIHWNADLQNAFDADGEKSFSCEVLEPVSEHTNLRKREAHWLHVIPQLFNVNKSTDGRIITQHTLPWKDESRAKIAEANRHRIIKPETRLKLRTRLGLPLPEETKAKISTSRKASNALKTWEECSHGHRMTPENTYTFSNGRRLCQACRLERSRRVRAKKKSAVWGNKDNS
jgi:group I intron endonuclease